MSRPCKNCGHIQSHDSTHLEDFGSKEYSAFSYLITCREVKCPCKWYESMTNLEYLEWKYEKTIH